MLAVKASPFAVTVPSHIGNAPDVRLFLGFVCRWQNRAGYVRSMPYDAEFGYQPSRWCRTKENPRKLRSNWSVAGFPGLLASILVFTFADTTGSPCICKCFIFKYAQTMFTYILTTVCLDEYQTV
jgi:hypothetical protein